MKRWTWIGCAMAIVLAMGAPALAAEESKKAEEAKAPDTAAKPQPTQQPSLDGELAMLTQVCKLNDEQQAKLRAAAEAFKTASAEWDKANTEKIAAIKKAIEAARDARDEAAIMKAIGDAQPLMEGKTTLVLKLQTAIRTVLTQDQKVALNKWRLDNAVKIQYARANLTEEQTTKVRTLCDSSAKELADVKSDGPEAVKAEDEILGRLRDAINGQVLTAEQKTLMERAFGEPPMPPPPAKSDAPKPPPAKSETPKPPPAGK